MNPKIQISETGSKLLQQPNAAVVETTVEDFSRILRQHFQIMNERGSKSYAVRYIGKPYDYSIEECKSIQVFAHNRGTMFSPLVIFAVLDKFEIAPTAYLEAVASQGQVIRMRPQSSV